MPALQGYVTNRNLEETQTGLTAINNLGDAPIGADISLLKNNLRNTSSITVVNSNINSTTNTIKFVDRDVVFSTGTKVVLNNDQTLYIKNSNGKDSFQLSGTPTLQSTLTLSNTYSGTYVRSDAITFENITNYSKKRRESVETLSDSVPAVGSYSANVQEQITAFQRNIDFYNSVKANAYLTNNNIITDIDFQNEGQTLVLDPDNVNLSGISLESGPGLFIYNFVTDTKVRAFSDFKNVWRSNLTDTYLETSAKKITVGSLSLKKDDVINIDQRAGTTPNIVIQGVTPVNITTSAFTHTTKILINGEEYFLCLANTDVIV
jgi:hypothetical protein